MTTESHSIQWDSSCKNRNYFACRKPLPVDVILPPLTEENPPTFPPLPEDVAEPSVVVIKVRKSKKKAKKLKKVNKKSSPEKLKEAASGWSSFGWGKI